MDVRVALLVLSIGFVTCEYAFAQVPFPMAPPQVRSALIHSIEDSELDPDSRELFASLVDVEKAWAVGVINYLGLDAYYHSQNRDVVGKLYHAFQLKNETGEIRYVYLLHRSNKPNDQHGGSAYLVTDKGNQPLAFQIVPIMDCPLQTDVVLVGDVFPTTLTCIQENEPRGGDRGRFTYTLRESGITDGMAVPAPWQSLKQSFYEKLWQEEAYVLGMREELKPVFGDAAKLIVNDYLGDLIAWRQHVAERELIWFERTPVAFPEQPPEDLTNRVRLQDLLLEREKNVKRLQEAVRRSLNGDHRALRAHAEMRKRSNVIKVIEDKIENGNE